MIRITCTSCQNVLSIDDAFAGGVCRCQHCGTIQTVPAHLKGSAERNQPIAAGSPVSKSLYQNKARGSAVGSGSGLEDLAGIVASSGLSDNRLRKAPTSSAVQKRPTMLLAVAGGVIAVLIFVVITLWMRTGKSDSTPQTPGTDTPGTSSHFGPGRVVDPDVSPTDVAPGQHPARPAPAVAGPNCMGVKLSSNRVVYLIDNGSSSAHLLDYVKSAVYDSAQSLGPSRQFQIIFWNPDAPTYGPSPATPGNINEAKAKLEDVVAMGSTEAIDGIKKAVAANPGEIVLLTQKGYQFDDAGADAVIQARGASTTKIHVIDISGSDADASAARIASKTGGTFAAVSEATVKASGN